MSRDRKIVLSGMAVLVAILFGIGLWAGAKKAKQTEAATATVIGTKIAAKRGTDDTIVLLSFPAGGTTAQGRARVTGVHPGDYPAGRQIPICYDPADVTNLRMRDGACG